MRAIDQKTVTDQIANMAKNTGAKSPWSERGPAAAPPRGRPQTSAGVRDEREDGRDEGKEGRDGRGGGGEGEACRTTRISSFLSHRHFLSFYRYHYTL